jgi:hypothetical protein
VDTKTVQEQAYMQAEKCEEGKMEFFATRWKGYLSIRQKKKNRKRGMLPTFFHLLTPYIIPLCKSSITIREHNFIIDVRVRGTLGGIENVRRFSLVSGNGIRVFENKQLGRNLPRFDAVKRKQLLQHPLAELRHRSFDAMTRHV